MTTDALNKYLREVAKSLGEPWRAGPPETTGQDGTLTGPDGVSVSVSVDRGGERLQFETSLPRDLAAHQPEGSTRPVATVARSRSSQAVAKDLHRRFVPKVLKFVANARDVAQRRRRHAMDLRSVVTALAERMGCTVKPTGDSVSIGQYRESLYATAKVVEPTWRGEHIVRFSIDARPEQALAIAEFLRQRHDADQASSNQDATAA